MITSASRKITVIISLCLLIMMGQSFTQPAGKQKGTNLKVLPKDISEEELIGLMKEYAKSLGVKCSYCHSRLADDSTHLDFASDAKNEKIIARKMMTMTDCVNKKYLGKIDGVFEEITCVTCHMGKVRPLVSVDSLKIEQ